MRSGCGCGCLMVILAGLLVAGAFWFASGVFERPATQHEIGSQADGRRAQQKLFELVSGGPLSGRRDDRKATVTLTERELNALLARHLSTDEFPLGEPGIRLIGSGVVEITGRLPLHRVFGDSLGSVVGSLPAGWADRPVWLRLRGDVRLETGAARGDRRRIRLDVESFWVGRRRLPAAILTALPDGPLVRATQWPVPDTVDAVVVEPGRLTVTIRS